MWIRRTARRSSAARGAACCSCTTACPCSWTRRQARLPAGAGPEDRAAREARGLSREELAAELGETQLQLYRWETYEEEPGTALLGRIARILGCSTEELL